MDMEEWEILDFHNRDEKGSFSGESVCNPRGGVDVNYVICRSPAAIHRLETSDNSSVPGAGNRLVPVPVRLEPMVESDPDREVVKEISVEVPVASEKIKDVMSWELDQDPVSQVFFRKKENEFADMKVDSPKSSGGSGSRGFKTQIDMGAIKFEEKEEECKFEHNNPSKDAIEQEKKIVVPETKENGCWEIGGLNIWRWRVRGIGGLCSIGVAAAGIFIFILSNHHRQKQQNQNQKLQFQVYAEGKSINQVVQQASRLNQAISSVRGIPLARAHITFGGYYEGLQTSNLFSRPV